MEPLIDPAIFSDYRFSLVIRVRIQWEPYQRYASGDLYRCHIFRLMDNGFSG